MPGDLRRQEAGRQPPADGRTPLDRLARDERLQERADSCAGGIAVAAFLQRPAIPHDTDNHVGGGRDAFFGNEEMQLACVCQSESRQQSLARDDVLNEVVVAIEVEAHMLGPSSSHRHDRSEIPLLTAAHHCHGGTTARRLRHAECQVRHRHRVECAPDVVTGVGGREQQRYLRAIAFRVGEQRVD